MKRATAAAFVIGLLVGMGCGAAKVLPEPTTILVKVHLIASQNIDQLYVTGTVNGFDEFPRTYLPPDAGAPFNGPQSFRILLADSEDGKNVEIDVFGVAAGEPVAAGTVMVTVLKQHEAEADIDLSPNADGGTGGGGGGSGTGGGAMGGGAGTGGGGGGTVGSCNCDGGCCANGFNTCLEPKMVPLTRLPAGSFLAEDCGASSMACSDFCDPVKAVSCTAGKCTCGPNLVCRTGQRCVVSGTGGNITFACKCDLASGCQGCCLNDGTCVPLTAEDGGHCGAGGEQCQQCNGGSTAGDNCTNGSGVCGMVQACMNGQCATANDCTEVQFPTCAAPLNPNRCTACDPIRSNHCSILAGATSEGCACGSKGQCAQGEYCDNSFNCQPLF